MQSFDYGWTSADGIKFFGQGWAPDSPKALVCLVHGLGEHSARYAHVGKALADAGYALLAFDLRGHGRSGGPRGHVSSFEVFMQDIDQHVGAATKRYPNLPYFIYGHSLGGALVLNYALRRKPAAAGIIATAASLRTALESQKAKVVMARLLGTILPAVTINSGLEPETICSDPLVVQRYVDDPLVHHKLSFGAGKALMAAIAWALEHAAEFSLPLLVMHGTADRLGLASGSAEFAAKVRSGCTLKLWEGLSHELHNEPAKEEVLKYVIEWLDRQLVV